MLCDVVVALQGTTSRRGQKYKKKTRTHPGPCALCDHVPRSIQVGEENHILHGGGNERRDYKWVCVLKLPPQRMFKNGGMQRSVKSMETCNRKRNHIWASLLCSLVSNNKDLPEQKISSPAALYCCLQLLSPTATSFRFSCTRILCLSLCVHACCV